MQSHTYKWNNDIRLQNTGGGIGDKLAQAAARLVMIWFDGELLATLAHANIAVSFYKRYVDDGNFKLPAIEEGVIWDKDRKSLVYSPQPVESEYPPDKRTALIIREVANSITGMLTWTADFPSAHSNGRLPILDIETWSSESPEGTITNYSFYMKPMANPVAIPATSAISSSVKFNTYREEVKRVLRNTSLHLPWSHKAELLSQLSLRMKHSGYNTYFRSKIISEGLRGHMKKVIVSFENNIPFNRTGQRIREAKSRTRRNDADWFKTQSTQYKTVIANQIFRCRNYHELWLRMADGPYS